MACFAYAVQFRGSGNVFERKCERTFEFKSIRKEKLSVNTFSEKSWFLKVFEIVEIKLKGIQDFIIEAVCIPSVCTPLPNQQCNKVVNVFPHFRNLKFADNINEQNKTID